MKRKTKAKAQSGDLLDMAGFGPVDVSGAAPSRAIEKTAAPVPIESTVADCHNTDCIDGARRHLADDSVDLVITDPPYGIAGDTLHKHYNRDENLVIDGYVEIPADEYFDFSKRWIAEAERVLKPGGSMYIVSGWTNLRDILNALAETRLELINHIIWKYNFGVFTRRKFVTSHYHILYLVKPGARPTFNTHARFAPSQKTEDGGSVLYGDMEDVWSIKREYKTGKTRHKNELPTELLVKMIQYSSNAGDLIVDFFAGSFSTAKVAKSLDRNSVSFEIGQQAFEHQGKALAKVKWGERLSSVPTGRDDSPRNQLKPWSDADLDALGDRFRALKADGLTKKASIDRLGEELGRGYFSILNALKRRDL